MLDSGMIEKIESFVYKEPRSVDDIARHIKKNWRTADRYVHEIEKEHGTIAAKVFRPGSRGALKIVFWNSLEKATRSVFQEKLEEDILSAKSKEDFSQFDIFQYVPANAKRASIESASNESSTDLEQVAHILRSTKKQLLIFSGNLSFVNDSNKKINLYSEIAELVKRGVSIKVICKIDLIGKENIEKMLSLNFKHGTDVIEMHHKDQPLRCIISDGEIIRMKEVKEPTGMINELNKRMFIFYTIKDREWAGWLSRIFWKMFSSSIDAKKRLEELRMIK